MPGDGPKTIAAFGMAWRGWEIAASACIGAAPY